jgi:hypothetical protein
MAKLREDEIGEADLKEFLERESDFAFELQVLERLRNLGLSCEHGGTYEDRQTSKLRQFDIRARTKLGYGELHLAVECKHLRPNYPLLILRVPRRQDESFHDTLLTVDRERAHIAGSDVVPAMEPQAEVIRVSAQHSVYSPDEGVGKSCSQVGRDANGVTGSDAALFTKWTQAICSGQAVLEKVFNEVPDDKEGWVLSLVAPVVVVPDGRLWAVDYDDNGKRIGDPQQVARCSYFVSSEYSVRDLSGGMNYTFSHIDFVTFSELAHFIAMFGSRDEGPNREYFPFSEARKLME